MIFPAPPRAGLFFVSCATNSDISVIISAVRLPDQMKKPPQGWLFATYQKVKYFRKTTRGELLLHFARTEKERRATASQNASVTAKTPHRGVSSRCVQLPSPTHRQNTEKPPQGWLFHVLVDPRGVEPLSENPLGRLSSWAVCYEVLPGGAQTDTRHRDGSPFLDDRFKDETPMHLPC